MIQRFVVMTSDLKCVYDCNNERDAQEWAVHQAETQGKAQTFFVMEVKWEVQASIKVKIVAGGINA